MSKFFKTLGPGILFASTAIGVSHLVQSTQAGGNFGFTLLWAIILANIFKYPFFEYGSRYANATGTTLIEGYRKLGKPVLLIYFVITLISMFLVTAAVVNVTAGFMQNLFGIKNETVSVLLLLFVCLFILISGKYTVLDSLTKIVGIVLLISTLSAFFIAVIKGPQGSLPLWSMDGLDQKKYWLFLIPLMGWMPTAVDLSSWNSIWTLERIKQTGYRPKLKETLREFNIGYWISALLSICFVTLGAFIMFGTNKTFSASGVAFSGEVIELYTSTFGEWAKFIISISAFSIMFGTSIAVFDGYTRAMSETLKKVASNFTNKLQPQKLYRILLITIIVGAFLLINSYHSDPKGFLKLVTLSTSISFLFAPFVAFFNLKLVNKKFIGEAAPSLFNRIIAWIGIIFLIFFSLFYLFQDLIIPYLI